MKTGGTDNSFSLAGVGKRKRVVVIGTTGFREGFND